MLDQIQVFIASNPLDVILGTIGGVTLLVSIIKKRKPGYFIGGILLLFIIIPISKYTIEEQEKQQKQEEYTKQMEETNKVIEEANKAIEKANKAIEEPLKVIKHGKIE